MDDCFFLARSFIIECVDRMCQSFLSGCVFFPPLFQPMFSTLLWIFDFSLPVGDKFFQSDDSGTVS